MSWLSNLFSKNARPVVRIAPSPTGLFHVGTARAALFNYLFARRHGGTFIVRIEDTDRERSKPEYEKDILENLAWLGLEHDALYRQSERTDMYRAELERLISEGSAYVSKEESKNEPGTQVEVVRLKNPGRSVTFSDRIRGDITFDTKELGDFVIARSVSDPLYHFAVVVDDVRMGVTHVIRGEDHISNTPRQILIQEALGAKRPEYAHLPLILSNDRSKLSKRHGATSVSDYRAQGFLPEAVLNYLAFLGWHPTNEREIMDKAELIEAFSLEGVQKSGAVFDLEKFRWVNREHLKRMPPRAFQSLVEGRLPEAWRGQERLEAVLPLIRERIEVLSDLEGLAGELAFFFSAPEYPAERLFWKKETDPERTSALLKEAGAALSSLPETYSAKAAEEALMPLAEREGKGSVLWPLRVALSGLERSPDPFTIASILGKDETQTRIKEAVTKLGTIGG